MNIQLERPSAITLIFVLLMLPLGGCGPSRATATSGLVKEPPAMGGTQKSIHYIWALDTSGSSYCRRYFLDRFYGRTMRAGMKALRRRDTYTILAFDSSVRNLRSWGEPDQTAEKLYQSVLVDLNQQIPKWEKYYGMKVDGTPVATPGKKPHTKEPMPGTRIDLLLRAIEEDHKRQGCDGVIVVFMTDGAWDGAGDEGKSQLPVIKQKLEAMAQDPLILRIDMYGLDTSDAKTKWLRYLNTPKAKDKSWVLKE